LIVSRIVKRRKALGRPIPILRGIRPMPSGRWYCAANSG
jgi:hypothetical protein